LYLKAEDTLVRTVEDRLEREAGVMTYVVRNLKFVYVSDEAYFRQQVEMSIHEQQRQLEEDGFPAHFYYIAEEGVQPFQASKGADIAFNDAFIAKADSTEGVFHETLQGVDYTVSVVEMPEINGKYILLVPTDSYLGPIHRTMQSTLTMIAVSVLVSIVLIILFVRTLTNPLVKLQEVMSDVRDGNLKQTI